MHWSTKEFTDILRIKGDCFNDRIWIPNVIKLEISKALLFIVHTTAHDSGGCMITSWYWNSLLFMLYSFIAAQITQVAQINAVQICGQLGQSAQQ